MARITVEDCLRKENNRFALVLLAAKRTKQLLKGARPQASEVKNKPIVTALREIAEGQVRFMTAEESARKKEREEQERAQEQAFPQPRIAPEVRFPGFGQAMSATDFADSDDEEDEGSENQENDDDEDDETDADAPGDVKAED